MKKVNKAFTLVELIVVITILAILGTISFISLQGYSKKARDSKRTADIANIKVSLELFSLNTGYYPLPDNGEEVLYDNDLLWTQGVVGTNVTTNLGRNLQKKPTDPLHDIEYIYSLASSNKEYEVMSVYEGDLVNNSLIDSTYALDKYRVKVEGNYNELFVKTSKHIFPVPSIITSSPLPLDFDLVPSAIESQVITGGSNFPGLGIPNTQIQTGALKMTLSVYTGSITKDSLDDVKKAVVEKIQLAYSGSDIATTGVYKTLLEKTTDAELLAFVDDVVLNKSSSVITKISDSEAPKGGDFSMPTTTDTESIELTITCPEEDGVEMYISGTGLNTGGNIWEECSISKTVILTNGGGEKEITMKFRDTAGNETSDVSYSITLSLFLYTFTSHNFTTCGKQGRYGPTLSECTGSYNTIWESNLSFFDMETQGIQLWSVPESGTYRIVVAGAQGGLPRNDTWMYGGKIQADIELIGGDKLKILVGQAGASCASSSDCTSTVSTTYVRGGGGGSFVSLYDNTPIIVAGGGGGNNGGRTPTQGLNGVGGHSYSTNPIEEGKGGIYYVKDGIYLDSCDYLSTSDTGGGFHTKGENRNTTKTIHSTNWAESFINGGVVTWVPGNYASHGGFGGGGSTNHGYCGAGGGGYNGGDVVMLNECGNYNQCGGQGGTSFVNENLTNLSTIINTPGGNSGQGYVSITKL